MNWFDVDKQGLAQLLERRGKAFACLELIQNAWDASSSQVDVTLARIPGTKYVQLIVEDDDPNGFADLSHAFTLFAESTKKGDVAKRGRFNLGEKLVLALCEEAEIVSTKGSVRFNQLGRHLGRKKRSSGSVFSGRVRMTAGEVDDCIETVRRLLPPPHVETRVNGQLLSVRAPAAEGEIALATEVADDEGVLRRATRKSRVEIHEPLPGEVGTLYEMGIPVVETGDRWHVNVMQKVPLNFDRDNVQPAYLARVRAFVIERMAGVLSVEDANSTWARDAVQRHGAELSAETVEAITTLRFGDRRVAFDPSDPEANSLAVAEGYTVVHGAQMSREEWDVTKRAGAILPAGQVTPSPKPYGADGRPLKLIDPTKWTPEMQAVVDYSKRIARKLLNCEISVRIASDPMWPFAGTYGPGNLTLNAGRLGKGWFAGPIGKINQLLIHEFGHHYSVNHLSSEFHDALCRLGGQLSELALQEPELFLLKESAAQDA